MSFSQGSKDQVFLISDSNNINCLPVTETSPPRQLSDPDNLKLIPIWTGKKDKKQMIIDKQATLDYLGKSLSHFRFIYCKTHTMFYLQEV